MKNHSQEQLMRLRALAAERIRRAHDEDWADERRRQINAARYRRHLGLEPTRKNHQIEGRVVHRNPEYDPKRDGWRIAETPNQAILGDPLPGRSALEKRQKEGRA